MRMRLTPDCSKMLISTSSGYLLILHDLDLTQSLEVGSYRMLRARRTPLSSGQIRLIRKLMKCFAHVPSCLSAGLFALGWCLFKKKKKKTINAFYDFVDGGTSTSRSACTPRQGNDSSKLHPHREGQGES